MKKQKLKKEGDEIVVCCEECCHKSIVAYWDYEFDNYIFLQDDPFVCLKCYPHSVEEVISVAV